MDQHAVDPEQRIEVSLLIRPRRPLGELTAALDQAPAGQLQPVLSREAYAASFGADPADLARVAQFAHQRELEVVQSDAARRTVVLGGPGAAIGSAFGVRLLESPAADGGTYRVPSAEPRIPPELEGIVQAVFGLDTRPIARRRDA
jgi:kumamolisin